MPVSLMEPGWDQFAALIPARPDPAPTHPLGGHRRRVPDRVVFEHVVAALVHGSGSERIASPGCSDRTSRRLREWAEAGLAQDLHALVLAPYDRMIGLDLEDVAVDGCITTAPCGGERPARSPVDRGKQGVNRSTLTDATGGPVHLVAAGANRHDRPLLAPTLAGLGALSPLPDGIAAHLDRGDDGASPRTLLAGLGITAVIARQGVPAPLQVGLRWVVARTQSWMNGYGKLRRCPERTGTVVDCDLLLAAAFVVTCRLMREARARDRWPGRPTTRRLR